MNTFGKNVKISLFGEIYGKTIGLTIDGLPPGHLINIAKIRKILQEYQLKNQTSFKYSLNDFKIVSGLANNVTTNAPITIIVEPSLKINPFKDGTIIPDLFDYSTYIKYYGTQNNDCSCFYHHQIYKLLIIGGEICKQLLSNNKINIGSRIYTIKNIKDEEIDYPELSYSSFISKLDDKFPMINKRATTAALGEIKKAKSIGDSLGGIIETFIFNTPIALGDPLFDSFEATLSHLVLSISYARGITFGDITNDIKRNGSKTIDELEYTSTELKFCNNHQGGINNGITNGNLIYFKTYVKAPSNIPLNKKSVNILTKENLEISSTNEYSVSFLPETIYLVEAISYIVLLDLIIENKKYKEG